MTFDDLGIPFPLFKAPTDEATEYSGIATCSICHADAHCFELSIGCALIIQCPNCGIPNGLDADDRKNIECRECQSKVPFPESAPEEILTCYRCLRAGKAAITSDTELGMVSWEEAFEGVTHGDPRLSHPDFEMIQHGEWIGARIPKEILNELIRTPTYSTWQGEYWQFCCKLPMVYLGRWTSKDFVQHSPDDNAKIFFESVILDPVDGLWEGEVGCDFYTFQCSRCRSYRSHWDMD